MNKVRNSLDLNKVSQPGSIVKSELGVLIGNDRRYYNAIQDECWMTEANIAKKLRLTRQQVRTIKKNLVKRGFLTIEHLPNGNRSNPIHLQRKTITINNIRESSSSLSLETEGRYEIEPEADIFNETDYFMGIKWDLLQAYTAEDLNKMNKTELVELYMECNFLVLPTNYPITTPNGVICSCWRGAKCKAIGKHPVHGYKNLNSLSYESVKAKYLREFTENPDLNIGMKVSSFSVLDIDGEKGKESFEELQRERLMQDESDTLKEVITASTANGLHIFVTNTNLKNTASEIAPGLDIRSENGFLVMPGSVHKSGRSYSWNKIGDVGQIPDEWIEENRRVAKNPRPNQIRSGKLKEANTLSLKDIKLPLKLYPGYRIPEGQRHSTLFKWAARLRGQGAGKNRIIEELLFIRDTFCENVAGDNISDSQLIELAEFCEREYLPN